MTLSAYATELGRRLPTQDERTAANQLRMLLASSSARQKLKIVESGGETAEIILAPALSALLQELLRHVSSGDAVTLVPFSKMLTTQQAADILNVSRPFLIGLLEKGDLHFTNVGKHRRIKAEDLFNYKMERDGRRARALEALAEQDGELI